MDGDDPGDAALVRRASAGDATAFAALHARFAGAVHGLLLAWLPPHDAEDLLQEVFFVAWRRCATLRDAERFGPWLLAIARNAARRAWRVERRDDRPGRLPTDVVAPRADAEADGAEILAMIRALPEAYRETLALRLVEGWSGPRIAEATGLTHGSVRVNLHRGLQLLRERLREAGYA